MHAYTSFSALFDFKLCFHPALSLSFYLFIHHFFLSSLHFVSRFLWAHQIKYKCWLKVLTQLPIHSMAYCMHLNVNVWIFQPFDWIVRNQFIALTFTSHQRTLAITHLFSSEIRSMDIAAHWINVILNLQPNSIIYSMDVLTNLVHFDCNWFYSIISWGWFIGIHVMSKYDSRFSVRNWLIHQ